MNLTITNRSWVIAGISLGVLSIPLVAMNFTNEVNWSWADFAVGFVLLIALGFLINWAIQKLKSKPLRWLAITGSIILFILVWAELAVGIFNSPFAGS